MRTQLWMVSLALVVSSFALRAAQDDEIQQLKEMVKKQSQMIEAQNAKLDNQDAKIRSLEKAQAATRTSGMVDKAIDNRGDCYLAPDKPAIKGKGLSFTGEYLYWTVQRSKDVVGQWTNQDTQGLLGPGFLGGISDVETAEYGWSHGFRLGLNYALPYDGWDIGARYTYYRNESDTVHADPNPNDGLRLQFPTYGLAGRFTLPGLLFSADTGLIKTNQKFTYDHLDLELGRATQISKSLGLRLFAGPSLAWIKMTTKTNYYGPQQPLDVLGIPLMFPWLNAYDGVQYGFLAKDTTEADMYGLRVGTEANMKLKHGFSIVGKAAAALYAANIEHRVLLAYDADQDGIVDADEVRDGSAVKEHRLVPSVELEAGVAWEKVLRDNLNFKVFAGYQFRNYFNLYQFRDTSGFDTRVTDSDVGMHGLVFRIALDF